MKTLLEVQKGAKNRIYSFTTTPITIGADPANSIQLDLPADDPTSRASLSITESSATIEVSGRIGVFSLNGVPCPASPTVLSIGDVISSGAIRIVIRSIPEPPPEPLEEPSPEPEEPESDTSATSAFEEAPASESAEGGRPQANTAELDPSGAAYLYLFFAPVRKFLEDDEVSEIMINGPRQIFIERKGKLILTDATFPSQQALHAAVMNVGRTLGRFFDKDNPRLDARLPDGSRVHAVIPPLSRAGVVVAIRKFRREKLTLQKLIDYGSISAEGGRLIEAIIRVGRNLIVSGATSSGKTSVLNVLSALIPDHERILVLEDASELQLQQGHVVSFETRKADEYGKGEVTIRELLHSALRLRPDRIVVGEIRGGEALDLLQAMNTGHDGSMSTIHANAAHDALLRLETCALLSDVNIPLSALRQQVASAIQVIIQTARLSDGTRKITSITEVLGLVDGNYQTQDLLVFESKGRDENGKILGNHVRTAHSPRFLKDAAAHGVDISSFLS